MNDYECVDPTALQHDKEDHSAYSFQSELEQLPTIKYQDYNNPQNFTNPYELLHYILTFKLNLTTIQSSALLLHNYKLLIYIIVKGLRENYEPIIILYSEFLHYCDVLIKLLANRPNELFYFLDLLKAGLLSNCEDIPPLALNVIAKSSSYINESGMSRVGWNWLTTENGGLKAILEYNRNNKEIEEHTISILKHFGFIDYIGLFTNHILRESKEKLIFILKFIKSLNEIVEDTAMIQQIISFWIIQACYSTNNNNTMELLSYVILKYPNYMKDSDNEIIIKVLQKVKNNVKTAILLLELLGLFIMSKNSHALIVYKTLIHLLNIQELQELIIYNFKTILISTKTIPLNLLISELLKMEWNIPHIELLIVIAKHRKLNIDNALELLGPLMNTYVYKHITYIPLIIIIRRFNRNKDFILLMYKLIKVIFCIILVCARCIL